MKLFKLVCIYVLMITHLQACSNKEELGSVNLEQKKEDVNLTIISALNNEDYQKLKAVFINNDTSDLLLSNGKEFFTLALFCESEECLDILLKNGLDPNTFDDELQRNMVFSAIGRDETKFIDLLLSYNVDLNVQDANKQTPLIYAISLGFYKTAIVLLENGANPNITDRFNENALDVFIETSPTDKVFRDKDYMKLKTILENSV